MNIIYYTQNNIVRDGDCAQILGMEANPASEHQEAHGSMELSHQEARHHRAVNFKLHVVYDKSLYIMKWV